MTRFIIAFLVSVAISNNAAAQYISGESTVSPGTYVYTYQGGNPEEGVNWSVSGGSINWGQGSTQVSITWGEGGCSGYIWASESSGGAELEIFIVAITPGTASPLTQSISPGQIPITISCTAPSGGTGTINYLWQYSVNGSDWESTGVSSLSYTPGALTQNRMYRVAFYDECGTIYSNVVTVTVIPLLPTPGSLTTTLTAPRSIRLQWLDHATNETNYEIYRSQGINTNYQLLMMLPANTTSYIDQSVGGNTLYYYKVKANSSNSYSNFSNEVSQMSGNTPPILAAIENHSIQYASTGVVPVKASDSDGGIITLSANNLPSFVSLVTLSNGLGEIHITAAGASNVGTYSITVIAIDDQGASVQKTFQLLISSNYPPTLQALSNVSLMEDAQQIINLSATDPESIQNAIWSFPENLPAFVTFAETGAGSGKLDIRPVTGSVGTYTITVRITDAGGAWSQKSFTLTVTPAPLMVGAVSFYPTHLLLSASIPTGGNCNGSYQYQWQKSSSFSGTYHDIFQATGTSLIAENSTSPYYYKLKVTCADVTEFSNVVTVQPSSLALVGEHNSVKTYEFIKPGIALRDLLTATLKEGIDTTMFFDGMGRLSQIVLRSGAMPTNSVATDWVTPVVYDQYGRESMKYMPYAASSNDGRFKQDVLTRQTAFNAAQFSGESNFYSKTNYELSPLSRVNETFAPGISWAGTAGLLNESLRHSVKNKYWVNTSKDSVRVWTVTNNPGNFGSYATAAIYPSGTLFKNVTVNENGNQEIDFVDKQGLTILKKTQVQATQDDGTGTGHYNWLNTYFIYDDLNNLRALVQPKGVELLMQNGWNMSALSGAILNEFCFRFEYDEHSKMVVKKVPGAGEVWMVYDARDRLVLTQDSLLRQGNPQKWLYTLYDHLNRPIGTGLWNNANARLYHQGQAYNSTAYPNLGEQTYEELTSTYYDDYTWAISLPAVLKDFDITYANTYLLTASSSIWPYPVPIQKSNFTQGMATGSKVKVLGSNPAQLLTTLNFYDEKGRIIQTRSQNISGGVDITTTQYSWKGQPLVVVQKQEKAGTNAQTHIVVTKMEYDSLGRVLTVKKTVSSNINGKTLSKPEQVLASNEYDALGQLRKKTLGIPIIDSIRFDYNVRGWLLGVNREYAKDAHQNNYFGFDLGYDKKYNGLIGNQAYSTAQYNGNITGTVWKTKGDGQKRKYDFGYDNTSRLQKALFTQYSGASFNNSAGLDFSVKDLTYDANGNILSMTQHGWKFSGSATIDSLLYNYSNSNRLKNVIDRANDTQTKLGDFRSSQLYMTSLNNDKTNSVEDYSFDGNGNLTRDLNKDVGDTSNHGITYNHLNLPSTITVRTTGGIVKGTITYTYDAMGNKLTKAIQENGKPIKTSLYLGGGLYENDTLQFLAHEEGRMRYAKQYFQNGSSDYNFVYDFFLKDHLRNVRVVLTEQKDTAVYMATMEAAYRAKEDSLFFNIPQTSYPAASVPGGYPVDNTTSPNDSVARVNGSGRKVGPSLVLKVMSGDMVDIAVNYFYPGSGSSGPVSDPLADILSALAVGIVGTTGEAKGSLTQLNNPAISPLTGALNSFRTLNNATPAIQPKAYLNWILLDEQLNYVNTGSGAQLVGTPDQLNPLAPPTVTIPQNGFLYVYVSNETQGRDVFFDNLSVRHFTGPMLEETHYYPFGLTMAGISSKAFGRLENRKRFNGIEHTTELELNQYDAFYRTLDPQIGRFLQIDPKPTEQESLYASMSNNPILKMDPLGDTSILGAIRNEWNNYWEGNGTVYNGIDWFNRNLNPVGLIAHGGYEAVMEKDMLTDEPASRLGGIAKVGQGALTLFGMSFTGASQGLNIGSPSVWNLSPKARGLAIEGKLGGNLPKNFPTIDKFVDGTATSIKSIDVAASTYQQAGRILSTLKGYVNKVANFEYGARGAFKIESDQISRKALQVAINPAKTSLNQWIEIAKAFKYANGNNVSFSLKFFK